jgi:glycosyltransferase involved in cell wall biosynthesis
MRIAILSLTSGRYDRGVETVVKELSRRWKKKHKVKVITAGEVRMRLDWQRLERGSWWRKFMVDYWAVKMAEFTIKALRQVEEFGADVVMPMNGGWQSLLVRVYGWIKGKKMVISGQAGLGWCDGWNLLMRPNVFVATSERNRGWAKRFYGWGVRVEMIYSGVDLKRFKLEGKKLRLGLERPVVLCVAGKDRYKRVEETIKAVGRLEKGSLLLAGGGIEQEAMGKKLLGKRFKRLMVKNEQMPEVYRAADVFTLVSESSEAFGIAYLEALASGLPVVATDDQLRREILGEQGIYVKDPGNSSEYASKLEQALRRKKKRPEGWLKKFDWDRIAEEYIEVFK